METITIKGAQGSGKTRKAEKLATKLRAEGKKVRILDKYEVTGLEHKTGIDTLIICEQTNN